MVKWAGLVLTTFYHLAYGVDVPIHVPREKVEVPSDPASAIEVSAPPAWAAARLGNVFEQWSTFGQLVKQSDVIIVGAIERWNVRSGAELTEGQTVVAGVRVESTILGTMKESFLELPCQLMSDASTLPMVPRAMVFASRRSRAVSPFDDNLFGWPYTGRVDRVGVECPLKVIGGLRGVAVIGAGSNEVECVRRYISHLRERQNVDVVEYGRFLESLRATSTGRVGMDATIDLLLLVRHGGGRVRDRILSDVTSDQHIAEYADWVSRLEALRSKQNRTDQNEPRDK